MEKIYLNWNDIEDAVTSIAHQVKKTKKKIGAVSGIARGGLIPAVIMSHKLNVPFMDDDNHTEGYILVMDDICDTGTTLEDFTKHEYILTATIHYKQTAIVKPDFYYSLAPEDIWIVYPWEQKNSKTKPDYATKGK